MPVAGLSNVVQRANVWMRERSDSLGFSLEPVTELRVIGDQRRENLDRDGAIEADVARLVHLAHAAGTERSEDFVRTEARAGSDFQALAWIIWVGQQRERHSSLATPKGSLIHADRLHGVATTPRLRPMPTPHGCPKHPERRGHVSSDPGRPVLIERRPQSAWLVLRIFRDRRGIDRVLNTCLYPGFRAILADLEEARIS